jgi:thiol-disulfide isomerase/thioredoxin
MEFKEGGAMSIAKPLCQALLIPLMLLTPTTFSSAAATQLTTIAPQESVQTFLASSLLDLSGKKQSLTKWKGNYIVVNFWATWCGPCRKEMPELDRIYKKFRSKGVVVVGVSIDDLETLKQFEPSTKVKYPILAGGMDSMNASLSLGNDRAVVPFTMVINKEGKIAVTYSGLIKATELEQDLELITKS